MIVSVAVAVAWSMAAEDSRIKPGSSTKIPEKSIT
jgi:hypothetical protein